MEYNANTQKEESGIIIAPAGCGKTESIINIAKEYKESKKILILTHTNAGIENIEKRLKKNNIVNSKYMIHTIASFCSKYVSCFKKLSEISNDSYEQIYIGMNNLMNNKHIQHIIQNTYSLMLVDEYQDCTLIQHEIIKKISKLIAFKVFGDPLQSIYNFENSNIKINEIINKDYKLLGNMNYPWRWDKTNKNLGKWIMQTRQKILSGDQKIFDSLPDCVEYFEYKDYIDLQKQALNFLTLEGRKVILFNIENSANAFCKKLGGRFYFQEEIQCKALKNITTYLDNNENLNIIKEIFNLGKLCFTNFSTEFNNIVKKVEKNDFNLSKISRNKNVAELVMKLNIEFSLSDIIELLNQININNNLKIYRKELWTVLEILIKKLNRKKEISAKDTLNNIRNSSILNNKFKYKNMVSRILLVKGLEFENVFIVNPKELTPELLYVALSRATKKLVIAQKVENNF